jgi:hypothetical protein
MSGPIAGKVSVGDLVEFVGGLRPFDQATTADGRIFLMRGETGVVINIYLNEGMIDVLCRDTLCTSRMWSWRRVTE